MNDTPLSRRPNLAICAPALLALLYMLPRILSAHFGLLDDAVTLIHSREVLLHPLASLHGYETAGRFLPCYWLYWAFWYLIGGESPAVYYLGNAALLAATVTAIVALMRTWGAAPFETWTAALFFLFSAPVAECYFTLSKGEPVVLLSFLCALLLAHRAGRARRPAAYWTLAGALMLLALGTRETSIASLGVVGVWLVLSYWNGQPSKAPVFLSGRTMAIYLGVLLAGAAPILIGRILLRSQIASGSYASGYRLTWTNISQNILMWSYYLARDFPALCLLLAAAVVLAWRGGLRARQPLLMMAAWMGCCIAIYLPWQYLSNYYLLPFSAAAAIFCGVMAGELRLPQQPLPSSPKREYGRGSVAHGESAQPVTEPRPLGNGPRAVLTAAAVLLAIAAVNGTSYTRGQIEMDEANAELLESLRQLPPESTVLMNVPFHHEYVYEIRLHLNGILGRPDLRFAPLDFTPPDPRDAGHPYYVVSMQARHERWPQVRGAMLETAVANWNRSWKGAGLWQRGARREISRAWQLADIGFDALWCAVGDRVKPVAFAVMCHSSARPPVDLRTSYYGWTIDPYPRWKEPVRVVSFDGTSGDVPVPADWEGGGLLEMGVYRPSSNRWLVGGREFALPDMQAGDVPVAGDWTGAGKAAPGFYRPSDGTWHLGSMAVLHFGGGGAVPLAGDWDGDGRDTPGVYWPSGGVTLINSFREDAPRVEYTLPAGTPVVVNWTGVGVDTVNTVKDGKWSRRFANCQCESSNAVAEFTAAGTGRVFAGRWR